MRRRRLMRHNKPQQRLKTPLMRRKQLLTRQRPVWMPRKTNPTRPRLLRGKTNRLRRCIRRLGPDNIGAGAITTEKIADNAVTEDKLSDELNAEIDGKANTADLGALATKDQITNADVADDAAIAKSKLASDVQAALDKAADAVSMAGASENSVLGTDDEGNPVWYEIAM